MSVYTKQYSVVFLAQWLLRQFKMLEDVDNGTYGEPHRCEPYYKLTNFPFFSKKDLVPLCHYRFGYHTDIHKNCFRVAISYNQSLRVSVDNLNEGQHSSISV